ncbi:MAG TPA: leukotoxin LktA family filamentous adhesin, partial [Burkholderiales bacterium]|nr:leukotoxin LktA family filamentous adhesin [Burkholderiales bacterium]
MRQLAPAAPVRALRPRPCAAAVCAVFVAASAPALAQQIVPDGRTATSLAVSGNLTNVTTATLSGANAFNSFSRFGVEAGNVVNLHVPTAAANLINIVRDERTNVHGILNSIKDGRIGGNVWFANPHGFVVGPTGVVNVGSLAVATPTQGFVNNFFLAPGTPNEAAVQQLLSGTAPRNATGLIAIQGTVNAVEGIHFHAGSIRIGGTLYSGARFAGSAPDFRDVVNVNGVASATNVVMREGRIVLVAEGDVAVSGTVAAPGGAGVRAGEIAVRAGGSVELDPGASLVARGNGERSSGGTVSVWAGHSATLRQGAVIDASAGASGDGGFIEFSARKSVELAGGEFRAAAAGGWRGTVLVDPETVTVSADFYSGGANHFIQADQSITVNSGVTVSTRNVAGGAAADQGGASSVGDSGNLTLQAPSIALQAGSRLLAHADGGFQPGDITLTATKNGGELDAFSATDTRISLTGAAVKGRNVTLTAASSHTSGIAPIVSKLVRSVVDIDSSNIDATGTLAISATALVNSSTPNVLPFGTIDVDSEAAVSVRGASALSAAGNATLSARSTVTAKALPGLPDFASLPGDAGVAVVIVDSKATVDIAGSTTASAAGTLGIAASNTVNVEAKTDASASGSTAVGGTVSVAVVDTTTRAAIGGAATVTQAAAINLAAESTNTIVASAKAAAGGAQQKGASNSKTEQMLGAYQEQASTSDGGVQVAAAVAVSDLESTTQAYLGSSAPVATSGALTVTSKALNQAQVTADGSSAEGGVGVGVGVALNLAKLANSAYIAQAVDAAGLTVGAVMADPNEANEFITSATSGAAASNVGVAGALALNVIENRTKALVTGTGVANAGGGDVTLLAANASEAAARAQPAAGGTTGDKFGLGASVAVHVATNETRAEVEDGGRIEGARDLTLSASGSHGAAVQAEAGAQGGIGLTPVVAVAVVDNTTTARLGSLNTGALTLAGDLLVSALHSGTTATSAKADTVGEKAAIGAAVAVTIANDAALATTARHVASGGGVAFEAHSDSTSSASAKASAKGGKEDTSGDTQNDGVDQEIGRQAALGKDKQAAGNNNAGQQPASAETAGEGGSTSKLSVAAAIAVNVAGSRAEASVPAGRNASAGGGQLRISASNNTDAAASADGAAVGDAAVGVGAAVAINVVKSTNLASLGAGTHSGQGVTLEALMKDTGDTTSSFGAEAKSGGGSSNVGVAGSLGLNVVDHASVAQIESGAVVNAGTGDVRIEAENRSESGAKALPAEGGASGAKIGIGASVAVNVVANEARAELADGARLDGGRTLAVAAAGEHAVRTEAEAGSEGGISVTPSAAVTVSDNQTVARLGAGDGVNLSGGATVSATHAGTVTTSAKGSSQGAKAAIGMAVAVTIANDSALATTNRDIQANGEVAFLARASQTTEATAAASAKGGKQEDENTQQDGVDQEVGKQASYGKSKQKAGSANQGQQQGSAQSGEGKVSVAAAVAANVADSKAQAFIPDGRTVNTTGALRVEASNNTDARAAADGSAAGGIATVGIGAAVAVNKVNALAEAYIGAATITADGVIVRAGMTDVGGDSANAFKAEARAGAGGGRVGIAGSLALNLVDVASTAELRGGAAVNAGGGDVEVSAES